MKRDLAAQIKCSSVSAAQIPLSLQSFSLSISLHLSLSFHLSLPSSLGLSLPPLLSLSPPSLSPSVSLPLLSPSLPSEEGVMDLLL